MFIMCDAYLSFHNKVHEYVQQMLNYDEIIIMRLISFKHIFLIVPSRRIFEKDIKYPVRLIQVALAHFMRLTDLIVTCVGTLTRTCRCLLVNEFTKMIRYELLDGMLPNCQPVRFIVSVAWLIFRPETPKTSCWSTSEF